MLSKGIWPMTDAVMLVVMVLGVVLPAAYAGFCRLL
jgi:hypothetical protein